jgi:hypothetical protein
MTYLPLIHIAAAAGLFLAAGLIIGQARALRRVKAAKPELTDALIEELSQRLVTKIAEAPELGVAEMKTSVARIRSDLDWFIGDKLIEQAVAMAKTGEAESEISQATGISMDEVHAIRRMRRH